MLSEDLLYEKEDEIYNKVDTPLFHLIGEAADELGVDAYIVGGYVRDLLLYRPSKDIDVVSIGRGIDLAQAVAGRLGRGAHISVFARFGTAQVKQGDLEIEFVGARRESYTPDSRKPSSRMVRWRKIRSAVTSRSMLWPSASTPTASVSSSTPSTACTIWRRSRYVHRLTPTSPSATTRCA